MPEWAGSAALTALSAHWSSSLAAWAIPPAIVAAATRDPWHLPVKRFAERAAQAIDDPSGPSFERAAEVLRNQHGTVLDVGSGGGAASLPLAPWTTRVTAVDGSSAMLASFAQQAAALSVDYVCVQGQWPEAAEAVDLHDVAVVHHVVYNVADIVPFLSAVDGRARRRVVLELPTHHPLSWMSPLWLRFHGVERPTSPIAGDLVEILSEVGVDDLRAEYWQSADREASGPDGSPVESSNERVALVTQRLCLPESREPEVAAMLREVEPEHRRDLVTVSWTPRTIGDDA